MNIKYILFCIVGASLSAHAEQSIDANNAAILRKFDQVQAIVGRARDRRCYADDTMGEQRGVRRTWCGDGRCVSYTAEDGGRFLPLPLFPLVGGIPLSNAWSSIKEERDAAKTIERCYFKTDRLLDCVVDSSSTDCTDSTGKEFILEGSRLVAKPIPKGPTIWETIDKENAALEAKAQRKAHPRPRVKKPRRLEPRNILEAN